MALPNNFVNRVNQRNYVPTTKWDSFLSPDLHPKTKKIIISALNTYPSEQISEYTQLQFDSIIRKLLPVINKMDLMWVFTSPHWILSRIDWVSEEPITITGTLNESKWFGKGGMNLTDVTMYGNINIITQSSIFHGFKGDSGDVYSKVYNNDSYWGIYISQSFILNTGGGEQDIFDFTNEREIYWRQHRNTINIWEGNSFSQGFRALKNLSSGNAILGGGRIFWNMWSTQYISPNEISKLTSVLNSTININKTNNIKRYNLTNYHRYLFSKLPIEYNQKTLLLEEDVDYQPDRIELYNRCLYFNGTSDHTFINSILIDASNQVDIRIKPSVGFANNSNVVDSVGQGQMFRFTQLLTSNKIGWYLFAVDDYTTVGTSRTSDLTWDWDSGDWYKLTYVKERNSDNNGYILQLKVNDTVAIEYQITDTQLSVLGYSLSWNLGALASTNTNGLHYKGYIHSVVSDNGWAMMFEEGAGTTVYANYGTSATITTANINLVRTTQVDAPLLELSGDVVGFYNARYFNGINSRVRQLCDLVYSNITGNSFTFKIRFSNLNLSQTGFNYVFNGSTIFLARYGSSAPNRWAWGNFFGWCIFEFPTTENMEFYCIHDISEVGMNRFKLFVNGSYQTRIGVDGVYNNVINDLNPINLGSRNSTQGFLNFTLEELTTYVGVYTDDSGVPIDRYTKLGNYVNEITGDTPSINTTVELNEPKSSSSNNLSVTGTDLSYTGRKDQPLTVGGVAVNLDATATLDTEDCNKHIEYVTGVVATLGTITAAFGEVNDGTQIQVSDLGIDGDKVFNNRSDGQAIKLARIDWSNGVRSVYLGGIDNKGNVIPSDKLYDASQVDGEIATIIYDTQDYHTSQKYYNHWVLYGTSQDKVMLLKSSIAPTYTYISSNTSIIYYNYFGKLLQFRRVADDGTTTGAKNDPNGDSQGWVNKSGFDYINIYCDYTSATNIAILYPYTLPSGNISFAFIAKTLDNYPYVFKVEDDTLAIDFQAELDSVFGLDVFTKISTIQEFFEALNGGPPTSGSGFPNGATPNYARDTLLINTTNGFDEDANSTNLCAAFTAACKQDGDASKLLQALYDSSEHDNTFAVNINHFKKVFSEVLTPSLDVLYEKNYTLSTLLSTGANNSRMYRFFQRHERIFYKFIEPTITLRNQTQTYWTYWKNFNINGQDLLAGLTDVSNTDSKNGQTNEYPSGIHLNNTQKQYVQLPTFKTLEYAYQSNEEYWRDTTDNQGNAVLDRHLVPINLEHSDKDFPCFKGTGGDRFIPETSLTFNVSGQKYKIQAAIKSYTSGVRCNIFGFSVSTNRTISISTNSRLLIIVGGVFLYIQSDIDLETIDAFIAEVEFTYDGDNSYSDVYFRVRDMGGRLLWSSTANTFEALMPSFDYIYASEVGVTKATETEHIWLKLFYDDVLTNYWVYTGNNSYLLQDKVGGNYGRLTTNDVTLNQGTQNVYNPFSDGKGKLINRYFRKNINNLMYGSTLNINTIGRFIEIRVFIVDIGVIISRGSTSKIAFLNNENITIQRFGEGTYTHTSVVEKNSWNIIRLEKTDVGFDVTVNGVTENATSFTTFETWGIGSEYNDSFEGFFDYMDMGDQGYWSDENDFIDEVNSNNWVDLNSNTKPLLPISKEPYDGTDVFGNELTTDKSQQRKDIETYLNTRGIPNNLLDTD